MHVLVAAHDLHPDPGSGGTGRYVHETARRLVDRGHRVSVVSRRRGDVPDRETVRGIRVARYDLAVTDRSAPAVLRQLPGARRAVARHVDALREGDPPDVVSFQGPVTAHLVDAAVDDSVPRTCVFHSPWPAEYRLRTQGASGSDSAARRALNARLRRLLEGRLLDRAAGVVTLSAFMRQRLRDAYGVDGATVVPGGVDADRFAPDAGRFEPVAADETALLTVRRLTPRMGHGLLLDAFARLAGRRDDVALYLAGDGPLREALERRAAALGVADRTTFLGYVPDADLPAAYATADAFVLPTVALEGFGLATLEALAAGTPVVGTAVGGTPEVLRPVARDARLPVDPVVRPDRDALADRLAALADAPVDRLAAAGRDCRASVSERFPWARTVDGLLAQYEAVAGG